MSDRIELRGIEVYARHGVLDVEKEIAQVFRIDVSAHMDLRVPGESDDLDETLDYSLLATEVREVVGGETHALIERVAARVADTVLSHRMVEKVVVTVHKPGALLDAAVDDISVTIERGR